jgi:hypothetical protein
MESRKEFVQVFSSPFIYKGKVKGSSVSKRARVKQSDLTIVLLEEPAIA